MKSSDLMLGDWILHNNKPKKVDVIWGKEVSLNDPTQVWESIYTDKFNEDEVQPIPLTPEILEKNFPNVETGVTWSETSSKGLFNIRVEYDKYVEGIFNYIHELQHALRLCEINKKIEI